VAPRHRAALVTTVDSKTFDQRGYFDVGQALNELPAKAGSTSQNILGVGSW
jgi:hypothetical protein